MRVLRIAELRRARILPRAEVLALALPPPLNEGRDLVLRRRLPREAKRRPLHVVSRYELMTSPSGAVICTGTSVMSSSDD